MNTIQKDRNGFISIDLKVANMRNEQNFTIYPYTGGDILTLQSSKRIMSLNLRTGSGKINPKNEQNGAYSMHLSFKTLPFQLDEETKVSIQGYFWNNEGKQGGGTCLKWENKGLFSN
jgi:hypothetical protein